MSAECMPGWIAFLAAITPPTGIVPGAAPAGQASGITAPATMVGTRISSRHVALDRRDVLGFVRHPRREC